MKQEELYEGREQSLIKHFILQQYIRRFALIVGSRWTSITYVDCFSGPWNARSEQLKDSSFYIALDELRSAKKILTERGHQLKIRCVFLEKDATAYQKLAQFAQENTDADAEVITRNCEFEAAIPTIVDFVRRGGSNSFPFIFIDSTGWTGFAMSTIAPLLRLQPVEVLINFMTGHIQRFLKS